MVSLLAVARSALFALSPLVFPVLLLLAGGIGVARAEDANAIPPSAPRAGEATSNTQGGTSGALRAGLYTDGDQTTVFRTLASVSSAFGNWTITGGASVDVISSSSVDVRSSPGLSRVEVVSGASGSSSTSGGKMSDRRLQATGGVGWRDGGGHAANLTASYANERDYNSISGGLNGSVDLFHRNTTLLGGFTYTENWIASVLDPTFAQSMYEIGASVGLAQVLSPSDALRLRYDGSAAHGYQASPYRNVRFGDWTTSTGSNQQITFSNTIGSPNGLPETVPDTRLRHALVLEWVHSLVEGLGIYSLARLGTDSWGVKSATASLGLRAAVTNWRLQVSYRFYIQSSASFYESKYTAAPSSYSYYTSDKELGREIGHEVSLDLARVLLQSRRPGDPRLLLDGKVAGFYYDYPGFVLLGSRAGVFIDLGLTWEL